MDLVETSVYQMTCTNYTMKMITGGIYILYVQHKVIAWD